MSNQIKPLTRQQHREVIANPVTMLMCRRAYETLFGEPLPGDAQNCGYTRICEHYGSVYEAYKFCRTMSNDPNIDATPIEVQKRESRKDTVSA